MKISQLILELKEQQSLHGDLEVVIQLDDSDNEISFGDLIREFTPEFIGASPSLETNWNPQTKTHDSIGTVLAFRENTFSKIRK